MATTKDFAEWLRTKLEADPKLARDVEMERRKIRAAEYWTARPTESTEHMSELERGDGIAQMLDDLHRLASEDGCVAAAWALEVLLREGNDE